MYLIAIIFSAILLSINSTSAVGISSIAKGHAQKSGFKRISFKNGWGHVSPSYCGGCSVLTVVELSIPKNTRMERANPSCTFRYSKL